MLILALTPAASLTAFGANVPQLLNYQGYLADSSGSPLDTQVTIQFVIYDDSLAVTPLWQQSFSDVEIDAGRFQVLLGSDGSLDDSIFSGPNRFLGITVGGDAEMVPRTRIVSVPYGLRSSTVVDNVLLVGPAADTVQLDPDSGLVLRATDAAGNERIVLRTDDSAICIYGSDGLLRVRIGIEDVAPAAAGTASAAAPRIAGGGAVSVYGVDGGAGISIYRSTGAARGMADPAAEEPVLQITDQGDIFGKGQVVMGTDSVTGSYGTVFGHNNAARGDSATVCGGFDNNASGDISAICGGGAHFAEALGSFVGGGINNHVRPDGGIGTICGGQWNELSGHGAVVCGGVLNDASGYRSFVGSGDYNFNNGSYGAIPNGYADTIASGWYSMVFGSQVYVNTSNRVVFYDGANPGRFGLNRDDRDGGISYPIHVGTDATNGNGAHLTPGGVWTNGSSRTFKENFQPLDGQELLAKISGMQIDAWHFQDTDERHVGPVSEDFVEAFNVGAVCEADGRRDDEYLSAGDVAGVALAGVKELTRENRELKQQIARLEAMLKEVLQRR
jgi:hypothetical protein